MPAYPILHQIVSAGTQSVCSGYCSETKLAWRRLCGWPMGEQSLGQIAPLSRDNI